MITISEDKLFKTIQELKEIRKMLPKDNYNMALKRHKIKIEYILLENILKDKGIDVYMQKLINSKNATRLNNGIVKDEQNEDER